MIAQELIFSILLVGYSPDSPPHGVGMRWGQMERRNFHRLPEDRFQLPAHRWLPGFHIGPEPRRQFRVRHKSLGNGEHHTHYFSIICHKLIAI